MRRLALWLSVVTTVVCSAMWTGSVKGYNADCFQVLSYSGVVQGITLTGWSGCTYWDSLTWETRGVSDASPETITNSVTNYAYEYKVVGSTCGWYLDGQASDSQTGLRAYAQGYLGVYGSGSSDGSCQHQMESYSSHSWPTAIARSYACESTFNCIAF